MEQMVSGTVGSGQEREERGMTKMETAYEMVVYILCWISEQIERHEQRKRTRELRRALREWEEALRFASKYGQRQYAQECREQYDRLWTEFSEKAA